MAHLLNWCPELMILIRSLFAAARFLMLTFCLFGIVVYTFSFTFLQLAKGTALQQTHFSSLSGTMYTLLFCAIFSEEQTVFITEVGKEYFLLGLLALVFILLGSVTLLNLLIGVAVEVVKNVSHVQKEENMYK